MDVVVEPWAAPPPRWTECWPRWPAANTVVTANKALLAERRQQVFAAAQAWQGGGVQGGWPSASHHQGTARGAGGNRIEWLAGIINGTSNFILSAMHGKGCRSTRGAGPGPAAGWRRGRPGVRRGRRGCRVR